MKKLAFITVLFFVVHPVSAQVVRAKLTFEKGDTIAIEMNLKSSIAQQAMGQSIDFNITASADHFYRVTNTNTENSTLNHQVKTIKFSFDGMGQKRDFDSNNEKDLNGQFGGPVRDMLSKKYDIIIDSTGNTLMCIPEKITLAETDSRFAIINNLLKDVTAVVYPPAKGSASFFKVFPSSGANKGDTWTEFAEDSPNNYINYTLAEVNDKVIVIDFAGASSTESTAEMMGNTATTRLNNKSTGKIFVDKTTGIIREKTVTTESTGTTETSFGTLPLTSKTEITIKVK